MVLKFYSGPGVVVAIVIGFIQILFWMTGVTSSQGSQETVNQLWEGKTVPYNISSEFDANSQRIMNGAMLEISENTCFKFKPRWSSETKFLQYLPDPTYTSRCRINPITSDGQLIVNLPTVVPPPTCFTQNNILRIILNSLGFTIQDYTKHTNSANNKGCAGDRGSGSGGGGQTRKQFRQPQIGTAGNRRPVNFGKTPRVPSQNAISPITKFCCENQ